MKLVEIIRGLETSDETFNLAEAVSRRMGKETVEVKESPGFVTTRINALIGNEAFYMLQEGIASARDIDKALKLGLNHPMGPFEMIDLVGLDTRLNILMFSASDTRREVSSMSSACEVREGRPPWKENRQGRLRLSKLKLGRHCLRTSCRDANSIFSVTNSELPVSI
jgi:3-hydroxyacyl-CoA dehydrogenase